MKVWCNHDWKYYLDSPRILRYDDKEGKIVSNRARCRKCGKVEDREAIAEYIGLILGEK